MKNLIFGILICLVGYLCVIMYSQMAYTKWWNLMTVTFFGAITSFYFIWGSHLIRKWWYGKKSKTKIEVKKGVVVLNKGQFNYILKV